MKNGSLEQFLDTGWFSESELFLNGNVYWCEAQYDPISGTSKFFVDKWAARLEDGKYYHSLLESDGTLKYTTVLEIRDLDMDCIKQRFLEAPIFDGKTFWQVEKDIAWVDDGGPIQPSIES